MAVHEKEIEIRWRDLDVYGHVNHVVFLTYLEEARDEWLGRTLGDPAQVWDYVVARVAIDYKRELSLADDSVIARCRLESIGSRASARSKRSSPAPARCRRRPRRCWWPAIRRPAARDPSRSQNALHLSAQVSNLSASMASQQPGAVLEVENLHTEFHLRSGNVEAVDGVSFSVGEGECVGLVGESGCGKSTTGLSIMKLLPSVGHVTAGSVKLLGKDLLQLPESEMRKVRGNDVSMIFQDPMTSLNPTWTVGRQIAEAVRLHQSVSQKQALSQAREVLDLVGMPRPTSGSNYYPHQLSGGLRQRVMIAMALACSPKLLIADEPTTALDVTIQAQILDLIDSLRRDLKMAVILITPRSCVIRITAIFRSRRRLSIRSRI